MPYNLTINFDHPINISAQHGDRVYGTQTTEYQGHDIGVWDDQGNVPLYLGDCFSVGTNMLIIDPVNPAILDPSTSPPNQPVVPEDINYFMFSKDKTANMSNVKGYFAEVEFRNNSKVKAELFGVGMEVTQSSK